MMISTGSGEDKYNFFLRATTIDTLRERVEEGKANYEVANQVLEIHRKKAQGF